MLSRIILASYQMSSCILFLPTGIDVLPFLQMSASPELPKALKAFCSQNDIDISEFAHIPLVPRYLRINPRSSLWAVPSEDAARKLEDSLQKGIDEKKTSVSPSDVRVTPLEWLDDLRVYSVVPRSISIAASSYYRSGEVYSMDAASMVSVLALDISPGDCVLDLCCAPGMKTSLIADLLAAKHVESPGLVVGVDASLNRLFATRSVVQKYDAPRVVLIAGDGTALGDLGSVCLSDDVQSGPHKRHLQKINKRLRNGLRAAGDALSNPVLVFKSTDVTCSELPSSFDRVLVDAECSHDGSIAHIPDVSGSGEEQLAMHHLAPDEAQSLHDLQLGLLSQGFKLLKPGGRLVYSTCSFARSQNEAIVSEFLSLPEGKQGRLVAAPARFRGMSQPSSLEGCLRLTPKSSNSSFQFVACIERVRS